VSDFLKNYLAGKDKAEDFYAYLERRGYQDMAALSKKYDKLPSYSENKNYYFDWGKDEEFSLAGIGPGECGAGVLDMIEVDLSEVESSLRKATELLDSEKLDLSAKELSRAISLGARCLLVTLGLEPRNDLEAFKYFKEKFVSTKFVSGTFNDITEKAWELNNPGLTKDHLKELNDYVVSLLNEVKEAYKNMDSSFKFSPRQDSAAEKEPLKDQAQDSHILDLKGVRCPMNYVQAKLFLENVPVGTTVEICLDEGEPIQNVPVSLKNDGQEILDIKKTDGYYKVLVKKLVDY
jgi:sulfite reductase (ferredoxin)